MSNSVFIDLYQTIDRPGADKLLSWLETTNFFTAPASTRFHGAYPGGLCEHSVNVYRRLCALAPEETPETLAICGLLHDLCKANFYKVSSRNAKNEQTGRWEKVPFYQVEDQFPYGHGEKSVFLVERFMRLKTSEALAIRWHMGGFDDAAKGGSYAVSTAFDHCPLAVKLHLADMEATYLDEKRGE
ncbi:HD domain-containing protein [Bittarella massiliensis (ex Durand et al. 2017)]|uniref:HD domain-containing protein n=1 Tax=Bittarella massiliensis (ex Durand et al. 2017) TaxID=1720313 RepID=A0AAW5KFR1_9FIRM|nr:HD domain-containing protein [Bittarella massiliensis (ex Durand et al. 2017)]MCQ4949348.1 HD domain-containing protein [Bittarella massiliensis (ex Durand et al. 2017)]